MAQPGERRFTFRLYEDNPEDRELLRKLGTLLADGRFRSKNEVLRKGIALVFEACYGTSGGSRVSTGLLEHEIREVSKMIAEEVLNCMNGSDIARASGCGDPHLAVEADRMTDKMATFLSGLNAG